MNDDAASLSRLHEVVLPPAIPWWPPAVGWILLGVVLSIFVFYLLVRFALQWRKNAYRREALQKLKAASDVHSIATLLRRTALAEHPRSEIACLQGTVWLDWLEARSSIPLTQEIREQLLSGSYQLASSTDISQLRIWSANWIQKHSTQSLPS